MSASSGPVTLQSILAEVLRQMDPAACLQRADDAVIDGDLAEADLALQDYFSWRRRGGFQPPNGDARAAEIEKRLAEAKSGQSPPVSTP
jgi:hypothetical protein